MLPYRQRRLSSPRSVLAVGSPQHQRQLSNAATTSATRRATGGMPGTGAGVCVCGYTLSWAPQIFHKETGGVSAAGRMPAKGPPRLRPRTRPGGGGSIGIAAVSAIRLPSPKGISADGGGNGRGAWALTGACSGTDNPRHNFSHRNRTGVPLQLICRFQ